MVTKRTIFLLWMLLGFAAAKAQSATVSCTTDLATFDKTEMVTYTITVLNAGKITRINPPTFKGFSIAGGPINETGFTKFKGALTRVFTAAYLLKASKTGHYTIAAPSVIMDGKKLNGNPVELTVTGSNYAAPQVMFDASEEPLMDVPKQIVLKSTEAVAAKIKQHLFIRVITNKQQLHVGEAVQATFKLYTRLQSDSRLTKAPSFSGFSVFDISQPGVDQYGTETYQGEKYNVYILKDVQLYPLQAGSVTIEPIEVENSIQFVKAAALAAHPEWTDNIQQRLERGLLPSDAIQQEMITLGSSPIQLNVLPLPEKAPASFKGAVGNFNLSASVSTQQLSTNDAGKLIIQINGLGNMPMITAPDVSWPNGFDPLEPNMKESYVPNSVPVQGNKIFEYGFTIAKAGSYTVPPITFSFYDPSKKQYATVRTDSIHFNVTASKAALADSNLANPSTQELVGATIFTHRLWIVIPVALLILIGLLIWNKKEKQKEADQQANKEQPIVIEPEHGEASSIPVHPLSATANLLTAAAGHQFYQQLKLDLLQFLQQYLGSADTNKKRLLELMDGQGVPVSHMVATDQLWSEIDLQLYTPFSDEAQKIPLYERADLLIQQLQLHQASVKR